MIFVDVLEKYLQHVKIRTVFDKKLTAHGIAAPNSIHQRYIENTIEGGKRGKLEEPRKLIPSPIKPGGDIDRIRKQEVMKRVMKSHSRNSNALVRKVSRTIRELNTNLC